MNPVASDSYSNLMISVFDERKIIGVSTVFQAFFGRPEQGSKTIISPDAMVAQIDIIRGNERTAALINRGADAASDLKSKNASDQDYSTFARLYPLAEEESTITADQLNKRVAGENPYMPLSKADRMKLLSACNHEEHIKRMFRMNERLAAQSVLTGKMDSILGTANVNLQYDFKRNIDNTITVATAWDQPAATIMADIDDLCNKIRENGKVRADIALVGAGALTAMLNNQDFKDKSDNRRFELIQVGLNNPVPPKYQHLVDAGANARGRLRTAEGYELWLFTYIDGYTAPNGDFTKYMPNDQMFIGSTEARADRLFGPGEILPNSDVRRGLLSSMYGLTDQAAQVIPNIKGQGQIIPGMFYFDCYTHANQKGIVTRTQTAPIFSTTMTDGFGLLKGLTTP